MLPLGAVLPLGYSFDPQQFAETYAAAGARFAQVCRPADARLAPDRVVRMVERLPLVVDSLHGLFGPPYDISSPDEAVRKAACQAMADEIRFCHDIGGRLLVVHPRGDADPRTATQVRAEQLGRSLETLIEPADRFGVRLAVENVHTEGFGADPRDLLEVVRRLGRSCVALCVDLGHVHCVRAPFHCLADLASEVACIHAADTEPEHDLHLLPGRGSVPWRRMFDKLRPHADTPVYLEVFEPLDKVAAAVTPAWRDFIEHLLDDRGAPTSRGARQAAGSPPA